MGNKVTVRDIAKRCNVSASLVSKALKGLDGVGRESQALIVATAKQMGYDFTRLKFDTFKKVVIFIFDEHDLSFALPFYSEVLKAVFDKSKDKGMSATVCTIGRSANLKESIISNHSDCAILLGCFPPELKAQVGGLEYPCVIVDDYAQDACCFNVDNYNLAYELTTRLVSAGARRLSFVLSIPDSYVISERERGFMQAIYDAGLEYDADFSKKVLPFGAKEDEVKDMVKAMLTRKDKRPDGLVAYNDVIALHVLEVIKELKLSVPDDIFLTGFDDVFYSKCSSPSITTANSNAYELGCAAFEGLINRQHPSNYCIKGYVVERESSRRA